MFIAWIQKRFRFTEQLVAFAPKQYGRDFPVWKLSIHAAAVNDSRRPSAFPTGPFTIFEPLNQKISEFYVVQERCVAGFKVVKRSVGLDARKKWLARASPEDYSDSWTDERTNGRTRYTQARLSIRCSLAHTSTIHISSWTTDGSRPQSQPNERTSLLAELREQCWKTIDQKFVEEVGETSTPENSSTAYRRSIPGYYCRQGEKREKKELIVSISSEGKSIVGRSQQMFVCWSALFVLNVDFLTDSKSAKKKGKKNENENTAVRK